MKPLPGTEGQDRDSCSDTQNRDNYDVDPEWEDEGYDDFWDAPDSLGG